MENNEISGNLHASVASFLGAYIDGELDLVKSIEIETHLKECPRCQTEHRNNLTVRAAMRTDQMYFRSPAKLQNQILTAVEKPREALRNGVNAWWRWMAIAASVAFATILAFNLMPTSSQKTTNDQIAQEVVSGHIRSLMLPNHAVDVVSSDQHTVKPWFDGKIDFAPPVKDFANQGFKLIGGRTDYVGNRSVAALVYQHQQHFINLYIWPSQPVNSANPSSLQGYNIVNWSKDGMIFWAVSDLNKTELQQFSQLVLE